ncbi:GNAT family N-acetyltransferase [Weissella confusa]|uniref:GNAT family N-acetyltransferase n=1 Tax=Weissella confusa TaxID=1583 RepID=UPI0010925BFB|nr:GNAT family N-acetyltransferase [Weissella confusa]MBJ7695124.1 GNAT family N-acetyltransferase [Weissella confusa]QBZ04619.1 GNAT family N-acetyltransferase [Weissella confusa]
MTTTLKRLTVADVNELREISIETFTDTFGAQNTPENLRDYLADAYQESVLAKELENAGSLFYFVMVDDEIAGYLKLNVGDAQSEEMGEAALEVERIYVRKSFQRRGLGRVFIGEAEKVAHELHKDRIWLGVWEYNPNAIDFYEKMGFSKTGESHDFYMGTDRQTDILMDKDL